MARRDWNEVRLFERAINILQNVELITEIYEEVLARMDGKSLKRAVITAYRDRVFALRDNEDLVKWQDGTEAVVNHE